MHSFQFQSIRLVKMHKLLTKLLGNQLNFKLFLLLRKSVNGFLYGSLLTQRINEQFV